jgi:acyl-CoA thioester hydrolase
MKVKIYYHHTDCGQVVYYANYLQFLEEARTEFLASRAIDLKKLSEEGRFFVVARQEVDYKSPAFYGDILNIDTRVNAVSAVRIDLAHTVKNEMGLTIIEARTVLAFVDKAFKPCVLPEEMRKKIGDTEK